MVWRRRFSALFLMGGARMTRTPTMQAAPIDASPGDVPAVLDSATIFRKEFRYVWSTLRRLGVHQRDVEDVTHEVLLRVHTQLHLYDPERPLRPWLFSIALGLASNYRRLA